MLLTRLAADRQIPILGICRGVQILNFAMGGTLYQDIYSQRDGTSIKHGQELDRAFASHTVDIERNSLLFRIMGTERLPVNSFHHQAINRIAPGFRATATAPDGIVEAIESAECKAMLGVQWHPECFVLTGDEAMLPLFRWLIEEASVFKEAHRLHRRILTVDSHCDTPMCFDRHVDFGSRDKKILVDLHKMSEGMLDAVVMVAYLEQLGLDDEELQAATAKADRILDCLLYTSDAADEL